MHKGQFAILKNEDVKDYDLKYIHLKDGFILSYHTNLPVFYSEKTETILIGYAWTAIGEDPQKQLEKSKEEILEAEKAWCGRYVLIIQGIVYTDAAALFGVFYSKRGISSDVAVLKESNTRINWEPTDALRWFPGPDTLYSGVKRLLPSQTYDLKTGKIEFRNPMVQSNCGLKEFEQLFVNSLQNMNEYFKKPCNLALTGGYDSRTLFALMKKAGLAFKCFTLEHDDMPICDIELPPIICKKANIPYEYYHRNIQEGEKEREYVYREFLGHMQAEQELTFYIYHQYDCFEGLVLRSGVWEISQEYERQIVAEKCVRKETYDYLELKKGPVMESFDKYFDWCESHPLPISDTARYFWEQRCSGWMAESEHGFDIYDNIISIQPMNCRLFISILLNLPKDMRISKGHQVQIVKDLCPEISLIPYGRNQDIKKTKKILKKIKKVNRRIRTIGLPRTIRLYKNIAKRKLKK